MRPNLQKTLIAGLLLTIIFVVFIHLRLYHYAFDDAYIHFRVVRQLIDNGVPYFNAQEPVKTSSSSGWTIYLYILSRINQLLGLPASMPQLVAITNAFITVTGAITYTTLIVRLTRNRGNLLQYLPLFVLYLANLQFASIGLMETGTALLLVGLAFHLWLDRKKLSWSLFAAAVFFRLELVVVLAFVGLYSMFKCRLQFRDGLLFIVIGVFPFVMYDLYFFGTLIPNTIQAKSIVYDVGRLVSLVMLSNGLIPDSVMTFLNDVPTMILKTGYLIILISLLVGIWISKARKYQWNNSTWNVGGLFLAWGVGIGLAYFSAKSFIFLWYVPLFTVPLTLFCYQVLVESQHLKEKLWLSLMILPFFFGQIVSIGQTVTGAIINPTYYSEFEAGARVRHYLRLGSELYQVYPEATLLTSEIGGLGYSFKGYILDGAGLSSPEALVWHPMKVPEERSGGHLGAIPVGFIEATNPEIIVSYDIFIEAFLKSPIKENYITIQFPIFLSDDMNRTLNPTLWGSSQLLLFLRKDFADISSKKTLSHAEIEKFLGKN